MPKKKKKKDEQKEEWKRIIFSKYGKKCLLCEATKYVQGAHVFSREYRDIKYDPGNGIPLCRRHHIYWSRSHFVELYWIVESILGRRKLKAMYKKTGQTWPWIK